MSIALELTNRSDQSTERLRAVAEERLEQIEVLQPRATHCRVHIDHAHEHASSGSPYEVVATLSMPSSNELVAREQPGKHGLHEPLEAIVRHAMRVLEGQVKDTLAKQRHQTKTHEAEVAIVSSLPSPDGQQMGSLLTPSEGDVPFGANAVVDDELERLTVGSVVRFDTAADEQGLRASTVKLIDKPGERRPDARA